jgi:two-component system chemotaxis sensor kinase CheA
VDDFLAELQQTFFAEADQILEELEASLMQLEGSGFDESTINKVFRLAHNFKGSSRSVGFQNLAGLAHKCEDLLSKLKSKQLEISAPITSVLLQSADALRQGLNSLKSDRGIKLEFNELEARLSEFLSGKIASVSQPSSAPMPNEPLNWDKMQEQGFGMFDDAPATQAATSSATPNQSVQNTAAKPANSSVTAKSAQNEDEQLRVSSKKLDMLVNFVGELVVNQTILHQLNSIGQADTPKASQIISYISKTVSDIQSVSMSLRLIPVKPLFQKLRRAVRDVASDVNKDINFIEDGEHVELDKTVVDRMIDPLTHMVRNAVDHGVETKEDRIKAGKSPISNISLSAIASDDRVIISLSDDGKGLDRDRILNKAIKNGLISESSASTMSEYEVNALIFKPGFSTKEAVTAISGRGVGMEVVQKAVEELKGTIQIESVPGKGTSFKISLPLSLSIIGGMVVRVDQRDYIVPVSQLIETIELSKLRTETTTGKGVMVQLRSEILPVYRLGSALHSRKLKNSKLPDAHSKRPALVTSFRGKKVSFEVDDIVGQQQVVLKRLGQEFEGIPGLLGGAILSSGDPGLVLNLHDLIKQGVIHAAA